MTHIGVVAPIFNEEQNIEEFTNRVIFILKNLGKEFRIIFIDDGSTDNSWEKISELCIKNSCIQGIKLSKNFGHHYAITAGLNHIEADWAVVMDTDLQDRPEVIPDLYTKANEGFDVVFVKRTGRPESFIYKALQKTFYLILKLMSGIPFDSTQANFSIISRKVIKSFNNFPEQARFYGSTLLWLGFKRGVVEASHGKRYQGKPSYSLKKRIKLAADIILAFSDRPLRAGIYTGIIFSSISFLYFFKVIYHIIFDELMVNPSTIITVSLFFTSGMTMVILGIIGIYIGQIFKEVKKRPLYIIDEKLNF